MMPTSPRAFGERVALEVLESVDAFTNHIRDGASNRRKTAAWRESDGPDALGTAIEDMYSAGAPTANEAITGTGSADEVPR